ncbi:MAG: alkaline phosphatase D family protein [Acidimicrobiales bacterium]|nr:alkaline phosphatase D family protein [Acidimicrobiales bacterium]
MQREELTRRGFLAGVVATAAFGACSDDDSSGSGATAPDTSTSSAPAFTSNPFTLGVASGDPLPDAIVLWTMLRPEDGELPDEDVAVEWEIGPDEELTEITASGSATAIAALGHSVHVDATGLEPDTAYFFRFRTGEHETPPARTRTFAAPGTTPERFRFAFPSCQNWEQGYYAAYRDVVETGEIDAFVFLGDYIYEYASGGYADERGRETGQDFECETVEQYRDRYALYRSDPLLQDAHARAPWIITWDDHEVDNDYASAVSEEDAPTDAFLDRRAAAYQVWYEFMPVRLEPPTGPDLEIYRSFAHGDLVRFHVLDTRQYRSDQQRGEPFVPELGQSVQVREESSGDRTMLGEDQLDWLIDGAGESTAVWDVLAQQVFMFGANAIPDAEPPVIVVDTWSGYGDERRTLLEELPDRVDNLVVLTGDFHSAAVGDLRADPLDQSLPVVGTEFMASSISSSFFDDDEAVSDLVSPALTANPQIKWFDARRGYTLCEVTPERWTATYRAVQDQFDESSPSPPSAPGRSPPGHRAPSRSPEPILLPVEGIRRSCPRRPHRLNR